MNDDCLSCIFNHLTLQQIYSASLVSKQFNCISNNELIWKQLFDERFYEITIHNNYKSKYKQFDHLDKFIINKGGLGVNYEYTSEQFALNYIDLKSVPSEIGLLTNLLSLDLSCNDLKHLPDEIGLLTNLHELRAHNNRLKSLLPDIKNLEKLKILLLGFNNIKQVPDEIGYLTNLKRLELGGNPLEYISPSINKLINLRDITIEPKHCNLLPDEFNRSFSWPEK